MNHNILSIGQKMCSMYVDQSLTLVHHSVVSGGSSSSCISFASLFACQFVTLGFLIL